MYVPTEIFSSESHHPWHTGDEPASLRSISAEQLTELDQRKFSLSTKDATTDFQSNFTR